MPTQQQIRDAIKTRMQTVAGIGQVHTFERYAAAIADLKTEYLSEGKILGWFIRLKRTRRLSANLQRVVVIHYWRVTGFMSLDDAAQSELTFDALVESLQTAFDTDETLGGLVASCLDLDETFGLQREDAGPVMFCGVLCHSAALTLPTQHFQ